MEIPIQDKGKYFRGLLILIGKDNIIHLKEKNIILEICVKLGFEPKFCYEAVDDFLENDYIDKNPPIFSSHPVAKAFFKDAVRLSLVDDEIQIEELEWLKIVADANAIPNQWLDEELQSQTLNQKDTITK